MGRLRDYRDRREPLDDRGGWSTGGVLRRTRVRRGPGLLLLHDRGRRLPRPERRRRSDVAGRNRRHIPADTAGVLSLLGGRIGTGAVPAGGAPVFPASTMGSCRGGSARFLALRIAPPLPEGAP